MFIYNNIKIADANDKLIQSCLLTEDETVWFSQEQTAEEESVMRILIAEDETELARGLKFLLEKNKFTVDMVHDGEEALAYFRCREYDVVILDIMMPKVNGLEALKQIRETGSGVPVLMLTADRKSVV